MSRNRSGSNYGDIKPPTFDDLVSDNRLARLFSEGNSPCALQLWILQIKTEQSVESRLLYGRLLPYRHSSNSWSARREDDFNLYGSIQAQIARLSLYVESTRCVELLRRICSGQTILQISEEMKLALGNELKARFGATALAADRLAYRPVAYLLNRDAHDQRSPSSPHGGAGAFSASITQTDKEALFCLGQDYSVSMTAAIVKHLNAETGLDFANVDTDRFGDIELLVFPALDDYERPLLSTSWTDARDSLTARFNPRQLPHFVGFQFHLRIENNGNVFYSRITTAERNPEGEFEAGFELGEQLPEFIDTTEIDIFGLSSDDEQSGTLCCRWRIHYVREINLQGRLVGGGGTPVKFDWLEKATRPATTSRVTAALTINHSDADFSNLIGGRKADLWVTPNRNLTSLFARLHPPKSDGRFFLRWSQGDGEGRLQFVEWFRGIFAKYSQYQITIFDPYFEAAGLGLLLITAVSQADYVVFTSVSRPARSDEAQTDESDVPAYSRTDNLLSGCKQYLPLLKRFKLRIFGLKEGRLHDRYILIMNSDGLPAAGFHLSNSLQTAAENYPLLITPIPADVLLKVEEYQVQLMQEAAAAHPAEAGENPSLRLLFNSATSQIERPPYERLLFLEKAGAGDVLSVWMGEPSLQGLSGALLKEHLATAGLLADNELALDKAAGLPNFFQSPKSDFSDFTATWDVLGDVLAHSHLGSDGFRELVAEAAFLKFLEQFVAASFIRVLGGESRELVVVDVHLFRDSIEMHLHSSLRPEYLFHTTKYAALTWADYYAVKFLWWYAPDALLTIAEAQMESLSAEVQGSDAMRLSLLSQIVSEISLSAQFEMSEAQRDRLLRSGNGLLRWLGLTVVEKQLGKPDGLATVPQLIGNFPHAEQVRALGWMVGHAAGNPKTTEICSSLVAALHNLLPTTIAADEFSLLVDSMRGHMRTLSWAESWLFRDVIYPLLHSGRASFDDACEIWIQELVLMLGPDPSQSRLFSRGREGQTTSCVAFIFSNATSERRQASLKLIDAILKRQQRIIRQPLASTSDWNRWNDALVVSMWILTFTQFAIYYLRQSAVTYQELERLSKDARELAMIRSMDEWRAHGAGDEGGLAAILDQIEELIESDEGIDKPRPI